MRRPSRQRHGTILHICRATLVTECHSQKKTSFFFQANYYRHILSTHANGVLKLLKCTPFAIKTAITPFIFLFLLSYSHAIAQPPEGRGYDYIVSNNNDTIRVSIILQASKDGPVVDSMSIQNKIIAVTETQTLELYPNQIKAFHSNNRDFESIEYQKDSANRYRKFCRRIISGEIDVFRCDTMNVNALNEKVRMPAFYFRKANEAKVADLAQIDQLMLPYRCGRSSTKTATNIHEENPAVFIQIVRQFNQNQRPKTSH